MTEPMFPNSRKRFAGVALIGLHMLVVALSAGISLMLPTIAEKVLVYWTRMQNDGVFLVSIELIVAVVLILFFNRLRLNIRDRHLARAAISAGLVSSLPNRSFHVKRILRTIKEQHGSGKSMMVIGSTGYDTFVDPGSNFRSVLEKCLWANILLLNPYSEEAGLRVKALSRSDFTLERLRADGGKTIELLKRLKASGRDIKLKFYSSPPLVKLVILGEYLWLQHYHSSLEVRTMPEYVLQHNMMDRSLYTLFYQYFVKMWENPSMLEYDLDTDELIHRDPMGCKARRIGCGLETDCEGKGPFENAIELLRTGPQAHARDDFPALCDQISNPDAPWFQRPLD